MDICNPTSFLRFNGSSRPFVSPSLFMVLSGWVTTPSIPGMIALFGNKWLDLYTFYSLWITGI